MFAIIVFSERYTGIIRNSPGFEVVYEASGIGSIAHPDYS